MPKLNALMLCMSLFLIGSCNESATGLDFSKKPASLAQMSQSDLMRYGYALQVAFHDNPASLKQVKADEVFLALSQPDLTRNDGRNYVAQYRTQNCVLDVFWRKGRNISHYEFRQRRSILKGAQEIKNPQAYQCVQKIIQDRRKAIEAGFTDTYAVLSLKPHKS